jgi:TNF receptor-associated factor 4
MCLGVYANGNGQGEGTHVSVGAHLMKGENDDHLTWPLWKVTVKLLNQLEDDTVKL